MNVEGRTQLLEVFATLIKHAYAIVTGIERVPHIQMFLQESAPTNETATRESANEEDLLYHSSVTIRFFSLHEFYYISYLVKLIEIRSSLVTKILEYYFKGNNVHECPFQNPYSARLCTKNKLSNDKFYSG